MTDANIPQSKPLPAIHILRNSLLLLAFAILILLAAWYAYHLAKQFNQLRNPCLIAIMIAGAGAAACFAGIIHFLDQPLLAMEHESSRKPRPHWFIRAVLNELKRVLLILQILTAALAAAAAGIMIFNFPIPGA